MRIPYVTLAALLPAVVIAAPASKPATEAAGFIRNAPLPKWVLPLAEIPRTERTDPVVVRVSETQAWVGATHAVTYHRAIQVNDSSALGVIGQFSISYFAQYQKLALHKVVILRDTQRLDRTASVNIRPLQRETNIESGMMGGATTLQLLLDDVRIGDTLWISYTIEGDNPVFGKYWSADFNWDGGAPAELKRLTVLHPRSRPLHWRQLGDFQTEQIAPQVDIVDDIERIRFESRGLEEVDGEPSTPADYLAGRVFQFSEYQDWQGVAAWADGLFPKLPATPALKARASELAKQQGQTAQAAAALHWVQNEIRYFSVSIGENSHRPQAPDVVLKRRYGDCKDKSYLLVSLLRELGITARPVLLSADAPRVAAKLLATPTWFNHVIVQITLDGRDYYVDPTRTSQPEPLATLPTAFPRASALLVDGSSRALITLPERADVGPRYEHIENIVVADFSGAATLEARDIYRGSYADLMRRHFPTLSAAEQTRNRLASYEKNYPGVTISGAPQYTDYSADNRIEIVSRYQLPKAVSHKDHRYAIDFDSQVIAGTIGIPDKLVRNFPFELASGKFHGRYRLRILWPASVRVRDPDANQTLDNPYYHLREEYGFQGNQIDYLMDYQLKQDVIPAADLPPLQEEAKKLMPFISGSLNFDDRYVVPASLQGYSFRNLDGIRHVAAAVQDMPALKAAKGQDLVPEAACEFARGVLDLDDLAGWEIKQFSADLVRHLGTMDSRPGVGQCMGQLAFAAGDFDISTKAWAGEPGIAGDSPSTRNLAWSQFYNGDSAAALATMARYQAARSKAETDTPSAADAASQIALLQRVGQPLPAALEQFARAIPDGPWPRPVLAMQLGLISPEQLIQQAEALPADASELALNDAWFYIGQFRLAAHDEAGASRAFQWYRSGGVRSSDLPFQAKAELRRLHPPSPSLETGRSAMRAKNPAAAVAAWKPGADAGLAENQYSMGLAYLTGDGLAKDTQQALRWIRLAAAQDLPDALSLLGAMYEEGTGVVADPHSAIDWYRKAAALGERSAQFALGRHYRYGKTVERDAAQALHWFRAAAEQGSGNAMASLGEMYRNAEGVAQDFGQAEFWNRRAIYYGNTRAMYNLALAYQYGESIAQDDVRAAALYRAAAEQGMADAQLNLGYLYEMGHGVKRDMGDAIDWYRKAADGGSAIAQNNLGRVYEFGKSVNKNLPTALEWFRKAAAQGHAGAMVSLGYHYENDINGGKQYAEAQRLYEQAAERNNATAEYNLAKMYEEGKGVPADLERTRYWYRRAAEHGDPDAQYYLARMYRWGNGVRRDYTAAAGWYDKAVQQGHINAQGELGSMYMNGYGVPRDLNKAVALLRQAADQGNSAASSNLGYCYEQGQGVDKDEQQAVIWYKKAADQASVYAQVHLAELYQRLKQDSNAQHWFAIADAQETVAQYNAVAGSYMSTGDYTRAEQAYLRGLHVAEQQPGEHSADLLEQLKEVSVFYMGRARFAKALPHAQRALALTQEAFGEDNPKLADPLELVGDIYRNLSQLADAESLYLRAMAVHEKAFGPDSAEVASSLEAMGSLYAQMEKIAKAEDFHRRAYAMLVGLFGEQHRSTAGSMQSLGSVYMFMGRYNEAETWYQRALTIREKLGPEQSWAVASTLNSLAVLYDQMGRYDQSEALFKRVLNISDLPGAEDSLGLAPYLNNMGRMQVHHGKYAEGEQLIRRALNIRVKILDSEHSDLAYCYEYLGELYDKQQRYADAEPQYQHALQVREHALGAEHSQVAESLQALGSLYNAQGRYDAAEPLLLRALAIQRKVLGIDHPDTTVTRAALAATYRKTSRDQAAADLERSVARH